MVGDKVCFQESLMLLCAKGAEKSYPYLVTMACFCVIVIIKRAGYLKAPVVKNSRPGLLRCCYHRELFFHSSSSFHFDLCRFRS